MLCDGEVLTYSSLTISAAIIKRQVTPSPTDTHRSRWCKKQRWNNMLPFCQFSRESVICIFAERRRMKSRMFYWPGRQGRLLFYRLTAASCRREKRAIINPFVSTSVLLREGGEEEEGEQEEAKLRARGGGERRKRLALERREGTRTDAGFIKLESPKPVHQYIRWEM